MTIKKILVATDFSKESQAAATHALGIARHAGAEIVVTHAESIPTLDFAVPYVVATPGFSTEQIHEIMNDARKRLLSESETLKGHGVAVSELFIQDSATHGIFEAVDESKADLLVLGTHGRHGVSRFLLGSVAQWVAQRAPCDVLAARSEAPAGGYKRILVPTDFSACSVHALQRATQLVEAGGTIDLMHFWSIPVGSAGYWGKMGETLRDDIRNGATAYGEKLAAGYAECGATINFSEQEINPRNGILDRLESSEYDLVVMGSHGLKGVKKLILGSVAEAVLRHAKNSVYIARAQAE